MEMKLLRVVSIFLCEEGRQEQEREGMRKKKETVQGTVGLGEVWKMLIIGQRWVGANAALEETRCRSDPIIRMRQEMEVKERA